MSVPKDDSTSGSLPKLAKTLVELRLEHSNRIRQGIVENMNKIFQFQLILMISDDFKIVHLVVSIESIVIVFEDPIKSKFFLWQIKDIFFVEEL